jgi:hypothetical protein
MANDLNLERGQDLFAPPSSSKLLSTATSIDVSFSKNRDTYDESSVQRKERKRLRKESKHRKRNHKEYPGREHHRSSRKRDKDDDDTTGSRKKRERKYHDR